VKNNVKRVADHARRALFGAAIIFCAAGCYSWPYPAANIEAIDATDNYIHLYASKRSITESLVEPTEQVSDYRHIVAKYDLASATDEVIEPEEVNVVRSRDPVYAKLPQAALSLEWDIGLEQYYVGGMLPSDSPPLPMLAGPQWTKIRARLRAQERAGNFGLWLWAVDRRSIFAIAYNGKVFEVEVADGDVTFAPNLTSMFDRLRKQPWFSFDRPSPFFFTVSRRHLVVIPRSVSTTGETLEPLTVDEDWYKRGDIGVLIEPGPSAISVFPLKREGVPFLQASGTSHGLQFLYSNMSSYIRGTNSDPVILITNDTNGDVIRTTIPVNGEVVCWDGKNRQVWWWRDITQSPILGHGPVFRYSLPKTIVLDIWDYEQGTHYQRAFSTKFLN